MILNVMMLFPEWFDDGEVKYRHYGKWQKPTFQEGGG